MASIVAAVALFSATALAAGSAVVQNQCPYDVYLTAVPAAGGGYDQSSATIASGQSWSQPYTILTNGDGWSIKLSMSESLDKIMQFEYTYHGDGTIWYDLSEVNGNPWDSDWDLTSNESTCVPNQAAYLYPTDDANGMQACDSDASVIVTLCSAPGSSVSISSSATASPPAPTTSAAPEPATTTSVAPEPTTATTSSTSSQYTWTGRPGWLQADAQVTTLVTSPSAAPTTTGTDDPAVAIVYETEVATALITVYERDAEPTPEALPVKRHAHHPHHAHAPEA